MKQSQQLTPRAIDSKGRWALARVPAPYRIGLPSERVISAGTISAGLFQPDNENVGPVFVAVRCSAQLIFPIGGEHEEASILRNISSGCRPEAVPRSAVGVGEPPNF